MNFEEWWKREGFSKPDAPFAAEAWEAATQAERERCAMVCEDMDDKHMSEAIRRGK